MADPYYPEYLIFLPTTDENTQLALDHVNGILMSPVSAAAAYNAVLVTGGGARPPAPRVQVPPSPGSLWTIPSFFWNVDGPFTCTVAPGTPWEQTLLCQWRGFILTEGPPEVDTVSSTPPRLGERYWVDGFELPSFGNLSASWVSRDASRTVDGIGLAYRAFVNIQKIHTLPSGVQVLWQRFYIRPRVFPTSGEDNIWGFTNSLVAGLSAILNVNSSGTLTAYNKGTRAFPGLSLGSAGSLALNHWSRIDIRIRVSKTITNPNPPPATIFTTGSLTVWVNGTKTLDAQATGGGGDGLNVADGFISSTALGNDTSSGASKGGEFDFDDWIGAKEVAGETNYGFPSLVGYGPPFPINLTTAGGTTVIAGFDFTSGSHARLLSPNVFAANHSPSWKGIEDWRAVLTSLINSSVSSASGLTSATASAKLALGTDYVEEQSGCPALAVGAYISASAATAALGWALTAGETETLPSLALSTGAFHYTSLYSVPSGTLMPLPALDKVGLRFVKDSGGSSVTVQLLLGEAEILGTWGPEDATGAYPPWLGIHNAPYPAVEPQTSIQTPAGTLTVMAGIFVGNSKGQDIFPGAPPHWWWHRPISSFQEGVFRLSSSLTSHRSTGGIPTGDRLQRLLIEGEARIRLANNLVESNQIPIVYQYVAVSDPAMRYLLNGAFRFLAGSGGKITTLVDPTFLPDAGFFQREGGNLAAGSASLYYKGLGYTGAQGTAIDAALAASVVAFASGQLTSESPLHAGENGVAYSLWRRDDGSGVTGWFDVTSYTGNGAGGTRYIPVRLNGQPPGVFAMVLPHDGAGYVRDPSHTGAQSTWVGNFTLWSTAIVDVSRPDQLGISTLLNANGTVYDVFVIGGTGNGIFYPVYPGPRPTPGPWPPVTPPEEGLPGTGPTCPAPNDDPVSGGQTCAAPLQP